MLLATAPDHTGRMRPEDVEQLRRLGRILRGEEPALPKPISQGCRATASSVWENKPEWAAEKAADGDSETRWGGGVGTKQGWLELDLGSAKRFDTVLIEEGWGRISGFEIQVKDNDQWRTIFEGKEIGPYFIHDVPATTARYVRLNILKQGTCPRFGSSSCSVGFLTEKQSKRFHGHLVNTHRAGLGRIGQRNNQPPFQNCILDISFVLSIWPSRITDSPAG